ncbi:MAG: Gfo/Idh/MocA family oxidoreductase, partial [Chitinophagaceae bacterium]|nr:Gfo/Idh/MocA family oxidoreductase [Chitinophagaceae bacterium]
MKKIIGAFLPLSLFVMITANQSCSDAPQQADANAKDSLIRLITLAPGHFHAALLQKYMYDNVSPDVHVYAPEGQELQSHLALINQYNTRADNPASWNEKLYTGPDFFDKMLSEKAGNVVVIAGNNKEKTDYIKKSVDAGLNVLADKPMAIDAAGFNKLKEAFASAEKNKVLLYDIMTERFEINSIL